MRIILGAQSSITPEQISVAGDQHFKQLLAILKDSSVQEILIEVV
jgi:hypothetical protein